MRVRSALAGVALACLALAACGHGGVATREPTTFANDPSWRVVAHFPVVLQTSEVDCGAAALASLLDYWGRPTGISDITKAHPPDPQRGIYARDLRDFARRASLSAYLLAGTLDDLERELAVGRPVLVGLVRTEGDKAFGHYAVVVGLKRDRTRVLLVDPAKGWLEQPMDAFAGTWGRARRVTLVVMPREPEAAARSERNSNCRSGGDAPCEVSIR
jgi:ABC-type bacteriocin/lantibiotic exporter with double-glycine peptidase domain